MSLEATGKRMRGRAWALVLWFGVWLAMAVVPSAAADTVGVVLLHGKWAPNVKMFDQLYAYLNQSGYVVRAPLMPWSAGRMYDKSFDQAMTEIDAAVAALRQAGAARIAVVGVSLGANAAIAYGARHGDLMAVVAISPGHNPESTSDPAVLDSIARATAMVQAGKGDDHAQFVDLNQGDHRTITTTADIYLSYWNPAGAAVMPANAAKLSAPFLWITSSNDPLAQRGSAYAFDQAPPNPKSKYVVVESGGHFSVASGAASQIVTWLDSVRDGK